MKTVSEVVWKCKAQPTADPPQDCDWPTCGCDPYADKVIEALQESGKLGLPEKLAELIGNALTHWQQLPNDTSEEFAGLNTAMKRLWNWMETGDKQQR